MKRKIQHDAVNNQEDEDSSAYPFCFPVVESFDNKGDKSSEYSLVPPPNENPPLDARFTI